MAAAAVAIVGLYLGRELITPILLSLVLVITVHPIRRALITRSVPKWLATTTVILIAWLILIVIIGLTLAAGGRFVTVLYDYSADIHSAYNSLLSLAEQLGYSRRPGIRLLIG